ncbi:MAG: class I SAM-dependent methyltransferase [Clostridiaceae bacterium]|nr:class I SAM-dependent methyltransferase [Clostridiaceae bacterium]
MSSTAVFDKTRENIFDELSNRWEKIIEGDHTMPLDELMEASDIKGKIVVDIGAGTGILLESGFEAEPRKWIALDLSSKMLAILQEKYADKIKSNLLEIIHGDVHHIPLKSNSVDRVLCHNAYPHFQDPNKAIKEIYRILKPEGLFIINHYSGREHINRIHSQSPNPVLSKDMLDDAGTVCEKLTQVGFNIKEAIDVEEKYRIIACKEEL